MARFWDTGEACILLAAFLLALCSVFIKLTSLDMTVLEACALSSGGCVVCLFLLSSLTPGPSSLLPKSWKVGRLVAIRGCCGALTHICYYTAVDLTGVRDATALFFTTPLFAILLECIMVRRLPGLLSAVGAVITALGATMISQMVFCLVFQSTVLGRDFCPIASADLPSRLDSWRGAQLASWFTSPLLDSVGAVGALAGSDGLSASVNDRLEIVGLCMAVIAAFSNAVAFVAVRRLNGAMSASGLTFWHHFSVTLTACSSQLLLLLPAAAAAYLPVVPVAFGMPTPKNAWLVFGVFVTQLIAVNLLNRGYTITATTRGTSIHVTQVVFSFMLDYLVLGHMLGVPSMVGASFIIAGVLILASESLPKPVDEASLIPEAWKNIEGEESREPLLHASDEVERGMV